MKKRRKRIPEAILAFLILQMTEALKTLHLNDILHRDIKLENILVNSRGEVKLTDFGVSKKLNVDNPDGHCRTFVGTKVCMAPERFGRGGRRYGKPSDIWSLGICVYELAAGELPKTFGGGGGNNYNGNSSRCSSHNGGGGGMGLSIVTFSTVK